MEGERAPIYYNLKNAGRLVVMIPMIGGWACDLLWCVRSWGKIKYMLCLEVKSCVWFITLTTCESVSVVTWAITERV